MFDIYIALGDSMSIDYYPTQDVARAGLSSRPDIGASALLYRNESTLFPEFEGNDLSSWFKDIQFKSLAVDGSTSEDLLDEASSSQISAAPKARVLVTLTLGGNDLLHAHRRSLGKGQTAIESEISAVQQRYKSVVQMIKKKLPNCTLVLTTIFDPTDGTGIIPTTSLYEELLPIKYLGLFNDFILTHARIESILVADVHKHFVGHGAECGAADQFWYWKPSPIEPSYIGASEIRRVWLNTLREFTDKNA